MVSRLGKPLVVINPIEHEQPRKGFGIAKGTIKIKEDIIAPGKDLIDN